MDLPCQIHVPCAVGRAFMPRRRCNGTAEGVSCSFAEDGGRMQVTQGDHICWACDPTKMGEMMLRAKNRTWIVVHLGDMEPDMQKVVLTAREQQRGEIPRARDRQMSEGKLSY